MNKTRFNAPVTALVAFAIFMQSFAFAAFAQHKDSDPFYTEPLAEDSLNASQSKIAPDLEESANEAFHHMRPDAMQKVIIQLKSETNLNDMAGDLSDTVL